MFASTAEWIIFGLIVWLIIVVAIGKYLKWRLK